MANTSGAINLLLDAANTLNTVKIVHSQGRNDGTSKEYFVTSHHGESFWYTAANASDDATITAAINAKVLADRNS